MNKVALIGCTSKKLSVSSKAVDMYSPSALFKNRLKYCKENNINQIYILYAKYGLLELDEIIEPYDCNLKKNR